VRGEPRGKLKKGEHDPSRGDCIDCGQCVHVCPTGIDIRAGQQEGCITCGLCIDACDSVMEKIARPKGLIRYASLDELEGKAAIPLFRRPRVIVYIVILTLALMGILYGLTHLSGIELKVLHERQPLYVMLSDGSIENKYDLKILNKTDAILHVNVTVTNGPEGVVVEGAEKPLELRPGGVTKHTIYAQVPPESLKKTSTPLDLHISAVEKPELATDYESAFFGPE
jgi:cytochrome c oxidase accessory protein FixG